MINHYITLLRPYDWVKNFIVFLPVFFSVDLSNPNIVISITKVFFIFCILSSTIYVFNDICDISQDKLNTLNNKNKPLALGYISLKNAQIIFSLLLIISISLILFVKQFTFYTCIIFLTLNILYSIKLKEIFLLEMLIISISYILRIYASSFEAEINLSELMTLLVFISVLFIISLKRKKELETNQNPRNAIRNISVSFFKYFSFITYSFLIIVYFYYSFLKEYEMKITFVFFFAIITRFFYIAFNSSNQSPVKILFSDKLLIFLCFLWTISCFYILYL
ncbi:MAG: hypothetical protein CBB97_00855 [Candidatus Endolissoclinum sp. TMED37]|nr:MAG: hypothetical protein CBB97_00855 [Candidatus Endolissoclinum sp. TMED37]